MRRLTKRVAKLLGRNGLEVEDGADFNELARSVKDLCKDEAILTDRFLGSLMPGPPLSFTPYLTLQGSLISLLEQLKESFALQIPFFLLLDDFDVLEDWQQLRVFSVARNREVSLVCFKYGVMSKGKKTSRAGRDRTYRPDDDYDSVPLDWTTGGLLDKYAEASLKIARRRMEIAEWDIDPFGVFTPWEHGDQVRKEIVTAMNEQWESLPPEERPTKTRADFVSKYGNAKYFQELRKRKQAVRFAGIHDITVVSSGVIRQYLEICKGILDRAYDMGWQPEDGNPISPEIQNDFIREYSQAFFAHLNQTSGHTDNLLSGELAVTSQELTRLVEGLSDLFYARLHSPDHREPEIITFAITDEWDPQVHVLLDVAVRESIFHEFSYPPKTSGGPRLPAFILNRRLTPRRNLSPHRMQGRIQMISSDVQLAIEDRKAFVAKFMRHPHKPKQPQPRLKLEGGEGT